MIVLYGIVCFGCVYIGVMIYKYLDDRVRFYNDFIEFLYVYDNNLSFCQDKLQNVVEKFAGDNHTGFRKFLLLFIKNGGEEIKIESIKPKEIKACQRDLNEIGKANLETDANIIKVLITKEKYNLEKATKLKNKYGSLAIKISLLIGILLVILLI